MSNYGIESTIAYDAKLPVKRRSFKVWLRDKLNRSIERKQIRGRDNLYPVETTGTMPGSYKFNNSFEGWQIRLHKANDGHVVEAWRSEETNSYGNAGRHTVGKTDHQHILFTVRSNEDMGTALNDILVQLALRM